MTRRPDYSCAECGIDTDTTGEYAWYVHTKLWDQSVASARRRRGYRSLNVSTYDLVCIKCFERRIHRQLTSDDFNWSIPLNFTPSHRSALLKERMGERLLQERERHKRSEAGRERLRERIHRNAAGG